MASELNLYRGKSDDAQMEIERLTRELNELKRKYYETKRREHLERSREYADPDLVVAPHPVSQKRFAGEGSASREDGCVDESLVRSRRMVK